MHMRCALLVEHAPHLVSPMLPIVILTPSPVAVAHGIAGRFTRGGLKKQVCK